MTKDMGRIRSIIFIAIGVLSVLFAISIINVADADPEIGRYVDRSIYGGDAYTGMQNASASTANNVRAQSSIIVAQTKVIATGFSYVFWLSALCFFAIGVSGLGRKKKTEFNNETSAIDIQLAKELQS